MKAEEFDKKFDNGEDVSHVMDLTRARKVNKDQKRVNVDFPLWMVNQLDEEAQRLGSHANQSSRSGLQIGWSA